MRFIGCNCLLYRFSEPVLTLLLLQCIQRSESAVKYKLNWSILEKSRTTFLSANQFREKKAEQRLDMESVDNQPDLYLE
jgi:hypothetical protein